MAGPIRIAVLANASQAKRELGSVAKEASTLGSKLGKFGKAAGVAAVTGLAVAGAAAVKFGADAVSAASDAQQSLGATETVFGKFAKTVEKTSNRAAQKYGLSANVYRENANLLGSLFKNQGVNTDELAGKTEKMIGTAADLSATFGGTTSEAVEALGAAFKGEYDMLERYGISIKQSDVNARLAAKGQDELTGAALKQAEQVAKTELINKQAAQANGAFAKESNTLAGQQQRLAAQFENIKAKVGKALLPVLTRLLTYLNKNIGPAFQSIKDGVAGFLEGIGPAVAFIRGLFASFSGSGEAGAKMQQLQGTVASAWASIKSIFSSAVSIVTSLWRMFGATITSYASSTFTNVIGIIRGAFRVIQGIFNVVAGILKGDWSRVWTGIKQIVTGAWAVIKGIVRQGWNIVRSIFAAGGAVLRRLWGAMWNGIKSLASSALSGVRGLVSSGWNGIKSLTSSAWAAIRGLVAKAWGRIKEAVSDGISKVVTLVKGLPGKITGALGDLGSLLFDAGADIIGGLLGGIESKFGAVKDKLGGLTNLIPDIKGPPKRDKVLLRPAGQLIMQGLIDGFEDGESGVRRSLERVTDDVIGKTVNRRLQGGVRLSARTASFGTRSATATTRADISGRGGRNPAALREALQGMSIGGHLRLDADGRGGTLDGRIQRVAATVVRRELDADANFDDFVGAR